MAPNLASSFNKLIFYLILIFMHLGCFIFTSYNTNTANYHQNQIRRKRKPPSFKNLTPQKAVTSSWSFLKRVFTKRPSKTKTNINTTTTTPTTTSFSSPRSSHHSSIIVPFHDSDPPHKKRAGSRSDSLSENPFFPLRNDIFPCPTCGEIFQKPNLLELHQCTSHAVSELRESDSGKNIVWIIFKTGWTDPVRSPNIHRILKILNGPKILSRFEEYRELVKSRAARGSASKRDERCVADGNELLRFHCTTFVCNLGQNGNSSVCNHVYCSACGIIRAGFSPKLDGISTLSTSWRAHLSIPDDVDEEFAFMNVKRAMLVCRVIAGRVGCDPLVTVEKEDPGFESLVGRSATGQSKLDYDELLVFNWRAVLPCFLIVYSVGSD